MQAVLPKKTNGQNPIQQNNAAQHVVEVESEAQFNIEQIAETEQDYAVALDHYVSAANNGSEQALEKIASMKIDLDYFSKGDAQLEGRVKELIESFNNVASMYNGINNTDECTKWMTKASSLESALQQIGCIKSCNETQIDRNELIEELSKEADRFCEAEQYEAEYIIWQFLAELGNARAEYCFGAIYLYGVNVVKDVEKGVTWLKKSAKHDDADAQYELGLWYDDNEDVAEAKNYFTMSAKNNDTNGSADYQLGCYYLYGIGVDKDAVKALEHFERGAELGDVDAQYKLGYWHFKGTHVVKNIEEALYYLKKAAKNNNANGSADRRLGLIYLYGQGVDKNVEKGLKHLKRGAEFGDVWSQFILGEYYFDGDDVANNIEEAKYYFEMAANNKNANGTVDFRLGNIYKKGDAVEKDDRKALKHFKRGAKLGNVDAQFELGYWYHDGDDFLAKNLQKAKYYYRKAANNKKADGSADFELGMMYKRGDGVVKNVAKALKHLIRAAKLGDVDAQIELGHMYYDGEDGVAEIYETALHYFELAVKNETENGYVYFRLGEMYQNGYGVGKNEAKALEYFQKGAELNDGCAHYNLGLMYLNGNGVVKNVAKALEHLITAAELGDVDAQFTLGDLYINGNDVVRDVKVALSYFKLAAENKDTDGSADYQLGLIYLDDNGVEQDDAKALKHLKRGAALGNNNARDKLTELLSIEMNESRDWS